MGISASFKLADILLCCCGPSRLKMRYPAYSITAWIVAYREAKSFLKQCSEPSLIQNTTMARLSNCSNTKLRSLFRMSQKRTMTSFDPLAREGRARFLRLFHHTLLCENRYRSIVCADQVDRWDGHVSRTSRGVAFCCSRMGLEFRYPMLLFFFRQALEEMVCRVIDIY